MQNEEPETSEQGVAPAAETETEAGTITITETVETALKRDDARPIWGDSNLNVGMFIVFEDISKRKDGAEGDDALSTAYVLDVKDNERGPRSAAIPGGRTIPYRYIIGHFPARLKAEGAATE